MPAAIDVPDRPDVYLAPAKLNLFLHVVGRRADGYHLIQSVFRLIDLADELTIVATDDGHVVRDGDVAGVPEVDDLAIRAARCLQAASGIAGGAVIGIHKRIPMGGGLGGGSSDAATVLLALNRLWRLDWPCSRLMTLAAQLGADVPFFVGGTNAFVEGIGERLTPLQLPDAHYAVIHPGIAVPTAAIFGAPELTRDSEVIKISDFSKSAFASSSEVGGGVGDRAEGNADVSRASDAAGGVGRELGNDLQGVATARYAAVRDALSWLSHQGDGDWHGALGAARMSGSGACVFRAFDSSTNATACVAALPAKWSGWAVRGLADHPLRGFCAG